MGAYFGNVMSNKCENREVSSAGELNRPGAARARGLMSRFPKEEDKGPGSCTYPSHEPQSQRADDLAEQAPPGPLAGSHRAVVTDATLSALPVPVLSLWRLDGRCRWRLQTLSGPLGTCAHVATRPKTAADATTQKATERTTRLATQALGYLTHGGQITCDGSTPRRQP